MTTTTSATTRDLSVGMRARRFASQEFQTIAGLYPSGTKGAEVTFEDGTKATVGLGAEWEVERKEGKPLRFVRDADPTITTTHHRETGLSFVIQRVEVEGPRGGRTFEYEVDVMEPGAGGRTERGIMRLDTAKAFCQRVVNDRLSGADR